MSSLFTPVRIGRHTLPNRLVMAPMTRSRAAENGVQSELAATYYGQRASAGLIISEGVFPTAQGKGYVRTPGIETAEQVAAWKPVTEAVHARGGKIFMQIMHCGRISHPTMQPGGGLPVAPSAIQPKGQAFTTEGLKDFVTPRALTTAEVVEVIASYGAATQRALEAGFDGVELHGATGYLPEQFLSSGSNQRTDQYGGSLAGRARFILEALDVMTAVAGADRVGIKVSPDMNFNDISDADPQETYGYLVDQLRGRGLAYLHVALFGTKTDYHGLLKPKFDGAYLMGAGLTKATAEAAINEGRADAAVFGGAFLANPDLPERLRRDAPLNSPDRNTFYAPGAAGYIDYPELETA